MNNEYIILNKTAILKRIEELEILKKMHSSKGSYPNLEEFTRYLTEQKILKQILLSQSTPLIPQIEKAFDAGINSQYNIGCYADGKEYICNCRKDSDCCYPIYPKRQDYIANLKLDI